MTVLAVDSIVGLVVIMSGEINPKAIILADLPPAACVDMANGDDAGCR